MPLVRSWKVTAKLYMDASKIQTIRVRSNTARKARVRAEEEFRKLYPTVGSMVTVLSVEEDDFSE